MRLLLDTHVALWAVTTSEKLPSAIQDMIAARDNDIVVSAASIWEISIKHALAQRGRSGLPISGEEAVDLFQQAGYQLLPIMPNHAVAVEDLPNHHGDPFDRMLVAQALVEPLRLVSHDPMIARYSDTVIGF